MANPGISGFFAGIFLKNNNDNMTTIKELLGQGDTQKPKKNFLQENVRRLKEMKLEKTNKINTQRNKTLQPLTDRRKPQTVAGISRSQQAQALGRLNSSPPRNKRSVITRIKQDTPDIQETFLVDSSPKGYRSQGCQTLNARQLETLYQDGIIRYPSSRLQEVVGSESPRSSTMREMGLQTEAQVEVLHPPTTEDPGLHWDEEKGDSDRLIKDFVRMNATIPEQHRLRTADQSTIERRDPTRPPASYQRGVVPKYIKEQKKEIEREKIIKAKEAADDCPEGHIMLPDEIRQKHLIALKENHRELVSQLNQLPVSTDSLRTRTRKKQIEADLDRIEAAITLFSREKVFVKAETGFHHHNLIFDPV